MSEIPSPYAELDKRMTWLREKMAGTWSDLINPMQKNNPCRQWHADLLDCLLGYQRDTVIFTHFVAINAAVAAATERPEVLVFQPDHVSVTVLETDGKKLRLLETGQQAGTRVI